MTLVYVAGPITGTVDYVERFANAERRLITAGFEVVNPVKACADLPIGSAWEAYMRRCLGRLVECDMIAALPGSRESRGAQLELTVAVRLGLLLLPPALITDAPALAAFATATRNRFIGRSA